MKWCSHPTTDRLRTKIAWNVDFTHNLTVRLQDAQLIRGLFWWLCEVVWGSFLFFLWVSESPEVRGNRDRKGEKTMKGTDIERESGKKKGAEPGVVWWCDMKASCHSAVRRTEEDRGGPRTTGPPLPAGPQRLDVAAESGGPIPSTRQGECMWRKAAAHKGAQYSPLIEEHSCHMPVW